MSNRLLISTALAALLAGTGMSYAQGAGHGGASAGGSAQHSGPAAGGAEMNRDAAPATRGESGAAGSAQSGMESTQSEGGMQHKDRSAQGNMGKDSTQKGDSTRSQSAQDTKKGDYSRSARDHDTKGDHNRSARDNDRTGDHDKNMRSERDHDRSRTTGQAGAHAKLSSEQRTKITTVIRHQDIEPVTNVNFSVSVGARVPRHVHFHPLPADIITIYPDWRGYEFFLARDEIIVVDPATLEIVAVLPA